MARCKLFNYIVPWVLTNILISNIQPLQIIINFIYEQHLIQFKMHLKISENGLVSFQPIVIASINSYVDCNQVSLISKFHCNLCIPNKFVCPNGQFVPILF